MERDKSLDGLKFILIFFVILAHVKYISPYGTETCRFISSFVMPLFVLLSGYFTKVTTWSHFWQWAKRILGVYVIFDILNILLSMWLHHKDWDASLILIGLLKPVNIMWYLMSLFWWRTMLQTLSWCKIHIDWKLLIVVVSLSVMAGFVPLGHELSFQRTFAWFPFFLLGFLFRQWGAIERIRSQKVWYFIPLFLVAFYVAIKIPIYMPVKEYSSLHDVEIRILQMLNGLVLSVCLLRLILPSIASRLAWLGKHTLFFYVYHTLPICTQRFYFEQNDITVTLPVALAICVVYVVVISLMTQIKPFHWLLLEK